MPGILLDLRLSCINESSDGVLFAKCVSHIKSVERTAAAWSCSSAMTRFIFINFLHCDVCQVETSAGTRGSILCGLMSE